MLKRFTLPYQVSAAFPHHHCGGPWVGEVRLIGYEISARVHDTEQSAGFESGKADRVKQYVSRVA
jgi:hypothetical protein